MQEIKPSPLDIEFQYQLFLVRMALSEATMHPQQKEQLRDCFYGAFGQLLILLRDDMPDDEQKAVQVYQMLLDQVKTHYAQRVSQMDKLTREKLTGDE